ncbi:MAG: hypothetical protein AAGK97_02820 [Bacteroidota bacterium]
MKILKGISILCFILLALLAEAQTVSDALRYSRLSKIGTGRSTGVANSMSAIGGDFAAIGSNPAGLGTYRFSEILLTPGFINRTTNSLLVGASSTDATENNVSINSGGVVFVYKPIRGKFRTTNLSIGFNRLADFNQGLDFEGRTVGSITQRFIELAQGLQPDDLDSFEAGPAFDAFAIFDSPAGSGEYFTDIESNDLVTKSERIAASGSMNEISIGFGANYDDKFYFGGAINIPFLEYRSERIYSEIDPNDEITIFNRLEYREDLLTSGSGINLHLGLIYLITPKIRVGASVKTPTTLGLTDLFSTSVFYSLTDPSDPEISGDRIADSPPGEFEYSLTTPLKLNGSLGIIFGKSGFLSAEVEYLNYGANSFNLTRNSTNPDDQFFEDQLNDDISNSLGSEINIRVGGELASKNLRLRAGAGLIGAPFDTNFDLQLNGGIGFRAKRFFADVGYQYSQDEEGYLPYVTEFFEQPFVERKTTTHNVVLTLGYKF